MGWYWYQYCCCLVSQSCPTFCYPVDCSMPVLPVPHHLKVCPSWWSVASVMPSNHLILWCPFLLLPSIFLSIWDFSNELAVHIWWPTYWSFSFSISPSSEYSGLISHKIDWFELLSRGLSGVSSSITIQRHQFFGALPSLQSSSLNSTWPLGRPEPWLYRPLSVEWCLFLLFNTLSRFVIAFLPGSSRFLIPWLQSPSALILEPKKKKLATVLCYVTLVVSDFVMLWTVAH